MATLIDTRMTGAEFVRKRRTKNIAIALGIVALYVLFYVVTVVRLGGAQ